MLGQLVGRYLRWFRNEYGATPSTLRDHEAVLARMSIMLADKEPIDVSVDDLRDVIDLWGERSPRTRQKVTSVVRAFWSWAEEQGHIAISPAARIRRPRAEKPSRRFCRRTRGRGFSRSPSTRATASLCSACFSSASGEVSWPGSRSATSTHSVARSACTAGSEGAAASAPRARPRRAPALPRHRPPSRRPTARAGRPPPLPDEEGLRRTRLRGPAEARRARLPEEAPQPAGRSSLVVSPTPSGGTRRQRGHARAEHAPRPSYLRHRASPRRRHRCSVAGARSRRPEHDSRDLRATRIRSTSRRRWTPTRVGWNSNGRTESFLPKLTTKTAWLSRKVEAAGIEPASADAPGERLRA
jgi:hypothetical protein